MVLIRTYKIKKHTHTYIYIYICKLEGIRKLEERKVNKKKDLNSINYFYWYFKFISLILDKN